MHLHPFFLMHCKLKANQKQDKAVKDSQAWDAGGFRNTARLHMVDGNIFSLEV